MIKLPRRKNVRDESSTISPGIATFSGVNTVREDVNRLRMRANNKVKKVLNKFYPGTEEIQDDQYKIASPEEYSQLAQWFRYSRLYSDVIINK